MSSSKREEMLPALEKGNGIMEKKANCMGKATAWMAGCANGMKRGVQVSERYDAILALRDQIAEARAAERHTQTVCPHCGEKTVAGMAYCGHCGQKL